MEKDTSRLEFFELVNQVQLKLNAPKTNFNSFAKYKYRSCEDILQALKLVLGSLVVTISDEIIPVGDRVYVKATATISDGVNEVSTTGYAREQVSKKGQDESQITGAASSYARKYALNGLFLIDDTKDADSQDNSQQKQPDKASLPAKELEALSSIKALIHNNDSQGIKDLWSKIDDNEKNLVWCELSKPEQDTARTLLENK